MILITGGGGFIGLNTAKALVDEGQEVLLVRRHAFELPSFLAPFADKQVKVALGDITELPFLYRVIKENNVDSIIHLAMMVEGSGSLRQVLRVAIEGTIDILEAARIFNMRRVTFASSAVVYSIDKKRQPFVEDRDLPVDSLGYVGATKKAGEQICQLYAKEYGLSAIMVRPSAGWGPLGRGGRFPIAAMVECAIAGKTADFSNVPSTTKRPFYYIRDGAKAISLVHLAPSLKHDTYNVSDGELHSYGEFADAVREVIPEAQIKLGTGEPRESPPMPIDRIKEDVGFTPQYDVRRGIKSYIDWVRDGKYT